MTVNELAEAVGDGVCRNTVRSAVLIRAMLGDRLKARLIAMPDRVGVEVERDGRPVMLFEVVDEREGPLPRPITRGACVVECMFDAQTYAGRIGLLEVPGVRCLAA